MAHCVSWKGWLTAAGLALAWSVAPAQGGLAQGGLAQGESVQGGPVPGVSSAAAAAIDLDALISQPVATELAAAPVGHRFAWVEDAASRRNLWVGGPGEPARNLTGYTADDGLKTGELAWSPDGKRIAYVRSTPYGTDGRAANPAHNATPNDPTVWVIETGTPDPVPHSIGLGHAPQFLPDGTLLFLRGGRIWRAGLSGGPGGFTSAARPLDEHAVYGSPSGLTQSPDGKQLAFLSSRDHGQHQLAVYNLETRALRWSAGFGRVVGPRWSPDSREIALYRTPGDAPEFATHRVSSQPWTVEVLSVASGQVRTIYRPQPNQPGSVLALPDNDDPTLAWTADGRVVFFTEEGGWIHLAAVHADGATRTGQDVPPGEVDRMALSPNLTELLIADSNDLPQPCAPQSGRAIHCMALRAPDPLAIDQRRVDVVAFTDRDERRSPLPMGLGGPHSVAAVAWSADGQYRAALLSDARRPMHPAVWAADGTMTELHPAADPPGLPRGSLAAPMQVRFPTSGEPRELHGQLFLPTNSAPGKRPAILYFHGGPRRQMQLAYPSSAYYSDDYAFNQYLASLGFVVLSLNYRSGLGYGLDFRQCEGCGAAGAAEYADVLAAQAYLAGRADVDSRRIGLWGGSYGGYLTALGLARNSDLFAAGVDISGVHDWILERNRGDWLIGSAAAKQAIAARAHASSPMSAINQWRSPVLLIHGSVDPDVNFEQTTTLAAALQARHVPVETLLLPGETHNFLLHRDWMASFTAAARVLTETLHPER